MLHPEFHINIAQLNMSVRQDPELASSPFYGPLLSRPQLSRTRRRSLCPQHVRRAVCPINVAINQPGVPSLSVIEAIPEKRH